MPSQSILGNPVFGIYDSLISGLDLGFHFHGSISGSVTDEYSRICIMNLPNAIITIAS